MIEVRDIISLLRSRLRTETSRGEEEKIWSEAELVEYVNMAYIAISSTLNLFTKSISFEISQKKEEIYPYPLDILQPLEVYIDGNKIPIKNIHSAISNSLFCASFLEEGIWLNGKTNGSKLVLFYKAFRRINDIDDVLYLKEYFRECVLFYAMFLSLQKEQRVDSLQRSKIYLNLYQEELKRVGEIFEGYSETKNIRTKYIRV